MAEDAPLTPTAKRSAHGPRRSYELALYPNAGKAEAARYAIWWQTRCCLDYVRELYAEEATAKRSTRGLGGLPERGLKRARDILRSGRACERTTGVPFSCPETVRALADARIAPSTTSRFQYWLKVPLGPRIPARAHRGLSRALRSGAVLRTDCEIRYGRRGALVALVFVEYPKRAIASSRDFIGVDVGVAHGVTTSDGRTSSSLYPILQQRRARNAERARQGHRSRCARTHLKQTLDREARRLVTLVSRGSKSIAIERLKTLGYLKPSGSIGGWARRHFGDRVRQIAEVSGVAVLEVHPAYTSQCCLACDHVDPKNRRGIAFRCTACGFEAHADVVGARNIQRKATGAFPWGTRKGRTTNMRARREPSRGAFLEVDPNPHRLGKTKHYVGTSDPATCQALRVDEAAPEGLT